MMFFLTLNVSDHFEGESGLRKMHRTRFANGTSVGPVTGPLPNWTMYV